MGDSRVASIISASGSAGGADTDTERRSTPDTAIIRAGAVNDRFSVYFLNAPQDAQYFTVTTGRGGDSLSSGLPGGIIKAFRIG